MSYDNESDIRVKCYGHSNLSRASVVQFRTSRYIMSPNQTCEWNVMTIRICRELPLFNFERLDELGHRIGHPCKKLWPFGFVESFRCSISSVSIYYVPESDFRVKFYDHSNLSRASVVQFRASRYMMRMNRTSEWKVMTILISRELPLFYFEHLEMLWQFELLEGFRCSISGVSIYYAPESDIRGKSYVHFCFSRAFVVQFRTSWYIMHLNRTSVWKVMTISISQEVSLYNFERLDILCPRIVHSRR